MLSPPQSLQDSQKRKQPSPQVSKASQPLVLGTSYVGAVAPMKTTAAATEDMTKEELEAVIREILADPTFPGFVEQVSGVLNSGDGSTPYS